MHDWIAPYAATVWAMGMTGALILLQLVVLDVAGIRTGHVPGSTVTADHGNFLFRATRAHANINESIAAFILLALFGVLSGASPWWMNTLAWVYLVARVAHMLCYYAGAQIPRSISFGISMTALVGMLIVGVVEA
ncbi:MAG TPA: MAPEG family protein [Candidatus Limnocylindrales bacterium]|nr:MAPEG family protein [Candidatus Limnocylindrales bacterium]